MAALPMGGVTLLLIVAFTFRPGPASPVRAGADLRGFTDVRCVVGQAPARGIARASRTDRTTPGVQPLTRGPRAVLLPAGSPDATEAARGVVRPRLALLDLPPPARA